MAVWPKNDAIQTLIDSATGAWETVAKTVKYQPTDQAYPTGAIAATQLASGHSYVPNSDLDSLKHYDLYVNAVKKKRVFSPDSEPNIVVGA